MLVRESTDFIYSNHQDNILHAILYYKSHLIPYLYSSNTPIYLICDHAVSFSIQTLNTVYTWLLHNQKYNNAYSHACMLQTVICELSFSYSYIEPIKEIGTIMHS